MFEGEEKVVLIQKGGVTFHIGFLLVSRPRLMEEITNYFFTVEIALEDCSKD